MREHIQSKILTFSREGVKGERSFCGVCYSVFFFLPRFVVEDQLKATNAA